MSIVSFAQLKDLMQTSWNTLKVKINEISRDYVSKTRPNSIVEETILSNGYVAGNSTITKKYNWDRAHGNTGQLSNSNSYYGIPSLSVPARTQVDEIVVVMHDDAGEVGASIEGGVNIGIISATTNNVLEYVKENAAASIISNPISSSIEGDKVVKIPINKSWDEDVYFLIGVKGAVYKWSNNPYPSNGGTSLPAIGQRVGISEGNYIGKMAIYTSKYSLNEVSKKAYNAENEIITLKNDYVSLTRENAIGGKTTLLNGHIVNNAIRTINNTGATNVMNDNRFCGTPSLYAEANTYISYLMIAVDDNFAINREVSGIKIAAVDSSTHRVVEVVTTIGKSVVRQNIYGHINSNKVILYPILKSYNTNVYFIAGFHGIKWGNRSNSGWATVVPSSNFPGVNTYIDRNNANWIYQAAILAEETNLNTTISSMNSNISRKAERSSDNTYSATNTFNGIVNHNKDVNIKYTSIIEQALLDEDSQNLSAWEVYFDRNVYIPRGSYVSNLEIRVTSDVGAGARLNNIYLYEIQRNASLSQDYIVERRTSGADVVSSENYGNVIRVTLNRTFDRDTYYMIGHRESSGKLLRATDSRGNIRYAISNNAFVMNPGNLGNRPVASNSKLIHRYIIERTGKLQEDMETVRDNIIQLNSLTVKTTDIGNEAGKIPRVGDNGKLDPSILPAENNGGVRTVNNQSPNSNGDVTILAEHIKYTSGSDINMKGAIDGKINTTDAVTTSTSGKIVKLGTDGKINENMMPTNIVNSINNKLNSSEVSNAANKVPRLDNSGKLVSSVIPDNVAKTDAENRFNRQNTFADYSPKVSRLFTRKHVNSNVDSSNVTAFDVNTYFLALNEKYTDNNKQISHVLLPIKNAQVGDNISIQYFMFNNNNRITYKQAWSTNCPVVDIEIAGCKCAKIEVNRSSGTEGVGFGFMVFTHSIDGRNLGAACVRNTSGSNISWTSVTAPNESSNYSPNSNITFPYKICYETTSELVTRFELENVTQMYPRLIGELKQLAYDGGETIEENGHTWLRANGQAISKAEYPALFDKINTSRNDDLEEIILPRIDDRVGYCYICAK